jgi:hypothetical protein
VIFLIAIPILLALAVPGRKLDLVPRRILRAIVAYGFLGYFLHGLYMILVNPTPGFNGFIADPRLLQPNYFDGLSQIAPEAALGLAVLLASMYGFSRLMGRSRPIHLGRSNPQWVLALTVAISIAWVVRMYAIANRQFPLSGLEGRIGALPTAALGVLVVCTNWRGLSWLRVVVIAAALGEALWSIETAVKTPLLAVAFFFYVDPQRKRISFPALAAGVVTVILAFAVIQPSKTTTGYGDYNGNTALILPATILTRFDFVRGLTDAASNAPGFYMTTSELLGRLAGVWVPQSLTGTQKVVSGVLWSERMENDLSGVHFPPGPTAEGYALYGYPGIVIWNLAVGAVAAALARLLHRRRSLPLVVFAAGVLASAAVFETGVLTLDEAFSDCFQLSLMVVVAYGAVRLVSRGAHRQYALDDGAAGDAYSGPILPPAARRRASRSPRA